MNWIVAQPLAGGMPLGFEKIFNTPPLLIITSGFTNDLHYIHYMNNVRKLNIPVINMNSSYSEFNSPEDESKFLEIIKDDIDAFVYVPLCSGLCMLNSSLQGSSKRGCADNDQNQNMYNLSKLGFRTKSKVLVFENAPGAYTKMGEPIIKRLREFANVEKYTTQIIKTNTLLHGIPQSRIRSFILFYRDTNPAIFQYEKLEMPLLEQYLDVLDSNLMHYDQYVPIEARDEFYKFVLDYTNSQTLTEASKKIQTTKTTISSLQLIELIGFDIAIEYFNEKYKNTNNELYSRAAHRCSHCKVKRNDDKSYWDTTTYIANDNLFTNAVINKSIFKLLHPTKERGFNIREMLWLMGHPNDFELLDPIKNWGHISQNVPANTAEYIAKQIKHYFNNKLEISSTEFVKQNNISRTIDIGSSVKKLKF